ncbi:MAG: hypothetical protein IH988_10415 [Planctomycetes bacterium]|nr:hypothetical protein [Planctomycetota bacterium]
MRLLTLLGAGMLFVGSADAALLFLESGGQGSVDLAPGESAEINIMLTIRDIDPGWAYAILYLNDDDQLTNGEIDVTELAPAGDPGPYYDRRGFTLPADLSWDSGNEYILIMGATLDGTGLGGDGTEATFILDTLTVTHSGSSTEGTVPVTFEKGGRAPQLFTEDFLLYAWGFGFDGVIPNFLDPGVGAEDNPFIINLVPAPECEGDANGDGLVDPLDSGFVLARFGCSVGTGDPSCDTADMNGDGLVDPLDVGFVLARFGECP